MTNAMHGKEQNLNDLISRSALKKDLLNRSFFPSIVKAALEKAPAVDAMEVGSCDGCHWKEIGRQQKCYCCRRNRYLKDCYERRADDGK